MSEAHDLQRPHLPLDPPSRVWEPFLTERDRQHLSRRPRRAVGFGRRPALILVDNYRAVLGHRPQPLLDAIDQWPASTGLEGWAAIAAQQVLLAECRQAGIPVIHVTGAEDDGLPGWNDALHAGTNRGRLDLPPAGGDRGIVDEVAPIPGEIVLRKSGPSAFWGTPLIGALTYLAVDTLLVTGEATSGCVRATVVDAAAHRLRPIVVEECVYDRHQAAHAMNLFDMHQKYADVLTLDDVVPWVRTVDRTD